MRNAKAGPDPHHHISNEPTHAQLCSGIHSTICGCVCVQKPMLWSRQLTGHEPERA